MAEKGKSGPMGQALAPITRTYRVVRPRAGDLAPRIGRHSARGGYRKTLGL